MEEDHIKWKEALINELGLCFWHVKHGDGVYGPDAILKEPDKLTLQQHTHPTHELAKYAQGAKEAIEVGHVRP